MYLYASRYISGWDHKQEPEKKTFTEILKLAGLSREDLALGCPSIVPKVTVGYWRKANAIHAWFVSNVQDGEDECRTHGVSREQLKALKAACLSVMADPGKAQEVLPPQDGFFFGSTAVDDSYLEDLQHTVKVIDLCLSPKFEDWDFQYQSSW